jgi:hypothetical protein
MMIKLSNTLILVGTNRNSGKTSLACELIRANSSDFKPVGIKISPHFHEVMEWEEVLLRNDQCMIIRETRNNTGKDSSRMLSSGAHAVYYIQVWDNNLKAAIDYLTPYLPEDQPIICESGWLRRIIEPGCFIILNRKGNVQMKENIADYKNLPHLWMEFEDPGFDRDPGTIKFKAGTWRC